MSWMEVLVMEKPINKVKLYGELLQDRIENKILYGSFNNFDTCVKSVYKNKEVYLLTDTNIDDDPYEIDLVFSDGDSGASYVIYIMEVTPEITTEILDQCARATGAFFDGMYEIQNKNGMLFKKNEQLIFKDGQLSLSAAVRSKDYISIQ